MGCMHMSLADFMALRPEEFTAAADAWQRLQDADVRRSWEIARTVAAILIQPHVRRRITAQKLLPLPWDRPTATAHGSGGDAPAVPDREEHRRRYEQLLRRINQEKEY